MIFRRNTENRYPYPNSETFALHGLFHPLLATSWLINTESSDLAGHSSIWMSLPSPGQCGITLNPSHWLREEGKHHLPGALIYRWRHAGWSLVFIWEQQSFQIPCLHGMVRWSPKKAVADFYLSECNCCSLWKDTESNSPALTGLCEVLDQLNVIFWNFWG